MRSLYVLCVIPLVTSLADDLVNSKTYNLINAFEAHKQGITGKGVNVGIADSPLNKNHISLRGKVGGELLSNDYDPWHGTAVGTIIAGNKIDNFKPYGVAYDSVLYSYQAAGGRIRPFGDFFTKNGVKIINASWGFPRNSWVERQQRDPQHALNAANTVGAAKRLYNLSRNNQILLVFASGNGALISPQINAAVPTYDEDLRSIINVGSLNPDLVFKQGDKIRITAKGTQTNGNIFLKSENYSLMAFGANINSAYAVRGHNSGYVKGTGTSIAAPMVSGAAALVAQKFPFLNGKQIADVLLSTANKDYQAPKLVVKRSYENSRKLSIAYIDNTPPTDDETIKRDLEAEGYTQEEATNIVNNLVESNAQYGRVFQLSKESVYGQGILDIKKALGGLSILDANRLNDENKQTLKNDVEELYYSVDTQGANAEFSNDITQKKWDSSLHLSNAKNLPTNMENLNVGFIKRGEGELTFSGMNTYAGLTIIESGALRLSRGERGGGGELVNSSVFVEKGGKLSGNGIIHKNLTNEGIVRVGNEDLSDLEVKGAYQQIGESSRLQLDFGRDKNSKLIAGSYDIQSGILEYIPLQQFFISGEYVKIDLGGLSNSIDNFTEVKVSENNAMSFVAVLDTDKTSINPANNPNNQPDTPDNTASDTPSDTTNDTPSDTTNDTPNNPPSPPNNPDKEIIVTPVLKSDAYNTANSNIGSVLREIRNNQNLSENYRNYFALLDNSPNSAEILKSIEGKSYLDNATTNASNALSATQQNMLFALNPTAVSSLAFNLKQKPQYVASVISDSLTNTWNFLELQDKSFFWYLSPSYKKINGDGNKGYSSGVDLAIGKDRENLRTTLNLKYSNTNLDFNGSGFDSKSVNLGVNSIYDVESFKILSGAFVNYGFNKMDRKVLGSPTSINAKYNNLALSLQMGVAKDWKLQSFTLTPLAYLNYAYYHQQSFKESGMWSKEYDPINHHTTSLASGLNLSYNFGDTVLKHIVSGFGIYEYRLSGKTLKNKARFNDFIAQSFTQQNELNKYLISLGVSYYLSYKDYFLSVSFVNELARKENNMKVSGSFGVRF